MAYCIFYGTHTCHATRNIELLPVDLVFAVDDLTSVLDVRFLIGLRFLDLDPSDDLERSVTFEM